MKQRPCRVQRLGYDGGPISWVSIVVRARLRRLSKTGVQPVQARVQWEGGEGGGRGGGDGRIEMSVLVGRSWICDGPPVAGLAKVGPLC